MALPKHTQQLLDLNSQLLAFDRKVQDFTLAKCAYERNMETCVLEQLYFAHRKQAILSAVRPCWETQCSKGEAKCLESCVSTAQAEAEELRAQVTAMVETTKRELAV